jgi:transcriptional regulator with XRE-family HTH domain
MDFSSRIKAARKVRGLTQEDLARRAGVNLNVVGSLERGDTLDPHYSTMSKLADGLGMSVVEFLEDTA